MFFMNLGLVPLNYPFTRDLGGIQRRIENRLKQAKKVLRSPVKVNNVFFNVGENEAVIEDRMLILLQLSISRQSFDSQQEIEFRLIAMDIPLLMNTNL